MSFPKRSELETAILQEVEEAGGRVKPALIYERVAAHFNLTRAEREVFYPSDQEAQKDQRWIKDQRFARQNLVKKGELDPSVKGEWAITPKGLLRIGKASPGKPPQPPGESPETATVVQPEAPSQITAPTIARLAEDQEATVRSALLAHVKQLSPNEFERLVARVLEAVGFPSVTVTGRTGDGGVDGECEMPLLDLTAAFQAKRYTNNSIGGPLMAQFRGQITGKYDRGIYITTSTFTKGAEEMAEQPGGTKILLIDGEGLVGLMMEHDLGVRSEPLAMKQIDDAFFARLSQPEG